MGSTRTPLGAAVFHSFFHSINPKAVELIMDSVTLWILVY